MTGPPAQWWYCEGGGDVSGGWGGFGGWAGEIPTFQGQSEHPGALPDDGEFRGASNPNGDPNMFRNGPGQGGAGDDGRGGRGGSNAPNNGQKSPTFTPPPMSCGPYGCTPNAVPPPPPYIKCVGKNTAGGAAGGFTGGVVASWFSEGVSIPIATFIGGAAGFGKGLVGCLFE